MLEVCSVLLDEEAAFVGAERVSGLTELRNETRDFFFCILALPRVADTSRDVRDGTGVGVALPPSLGGGAGSTVGEFFADLTFLSLNPKVILLTKAGNPTLEDGLENERRSVRVLGAESSGLGGLEMSGLVAGDSKRESVCG